MVFCGRRVTRVVADAAGASHPLRPRQELSVFKDVDISIMSNKRTIEL